MIDNPDPTKPHRLTSIDALRGLVALGVVACHASHGAETIPQGWEASGLTVFLSERLALVFAKVKDRRAIIDTGAIQ